MTRLIRDIYDSGIEFVRTFGAFQLFFMQLLRHTPAMLFSRFDLVVKQVFNSAHGNFVCLNLFYGIRCQFEFYGPVDFLFKYVLQKK